jgi:ribosome biogenesis protein BMS1
MQQLLTLKKVKDAKRADAKEKHREKYRAKVAEGEEKKKEREKRESEVFWKKEGRKRAAWGDSGPGNGRGKRAKR